MVAMGVIHGRFQVLHTDHLRYLLAGKERCQHLVVGITNPDPLLTREDPADPRRGTPLANPLTYFERYTLIRLAAHRSRSAGGGFLHRSLPDQPAGTLPILPAPGGNLFFDHL